MRSSRHGSVVLSLVALMLCLLGDVGAPPHARAWTDISVRTVRTHLDVDAEGNALVAMAATIHIHGGWLEGFEIAGLDPDLALDEQKPPCFVTEEGEKLDPRVHVKDGRVAFTFPRREAPRRGNVVLTLVYRTALGHRATEALDQERVRVTWTLPAWQTGLDGVVITALVPRGATFASIDASVESSEERTATALTRGSLLRYRRVHLPRTSPWVVGFDVPADQMSPSLRKPRPVARALPRTRQGALCSPQDARLGVLALLVVFAWLGAARRGRGLLPLGRGTRAFLVTATAASAVWLGQGSAWCIYGAGAVIALLAARASTSLSLVPKLGAWRDATDDERDAARRAARAAWLGHVRPLDGTTLLGAASFLATAIGVELAARTYAAESAGLGAILATLLVPIYFAGTRLQEPPSPLVVLGRLQRLAARITATHGHRWRAVVHENAAHRIQEARVRFVLESARDGLVSIDLVCASDVRGPTQTSVVVCAAVARAGSPAARALDAALAGGIRMLSRSGRRMAWIAGREATAVDALLAALAACEVADTDDESSAPRRLDLPRVAPPHLRTVEVA